ncbi:MAG: MOSC N-terminal beta barrel domain-containing protein [Agarilytica sp.]
MHNANDVTIDALFIYPVKSMAGISVSAYNATGSGFENDRQWAVFKGDRHPLTQRQNPRMALITPRLVDDGLYLSADDFGEVYVKNPDQSEAISFSIWKDLCTGYYAEPAVNAWLADVLKEEQPLRLAKVSPQHPRIFHTPERFSLKGSYFSDAAPYLIANLASLAALNASLRNQDVREVDIRHFRANIVIKGIPEFAEHDVSTLSLGNGQASFSLVDHCQRCAMITVDPDLGVFLPKAHPFRQLASLNPIPGQPKAPAFGVNARLSLGDDNIHDDTRTPPILSVGQTLYIA